MDGYLISIHALLTESDKTNRRTTIPYFYFYPRSPYGERPSVARVATTVETISIHALLTESDDPINLSDIPANLFLSTLSLRRATFSGTAWVQEFPFLSTLSLRRATYDGLIASANFCNFYPRSPYGERRSYYRISRPFKRFLSTLSLRRATSHQE